jgi:hypothetical protein
MGVQGRDKAIESPPVVSIFFHFPCLIIAFVAREKEKKKRKRKSKERI